MGASVRPLSDGSGTELRANDWPYVVGALAGLMEARPGTWQIGLRWDNYKKEWVGLAQWWPDKRAETEHSEFVKAGGKIYSRSVRRAGETESAEERSGQ